MTFERMEVEACMSGLRAIQVVPDVQERRRKEARFKSRILAAFRTMHASERPMVASRVCRELMVSEALAAIRRDIVTGLAATGLDVPAERGDTVAQRTNVSIPRGGRGVFGGRS